MRLQMPQRLAQTLDQLGRVRIDRASVCYKTGLQNLFNNFQTATEDSTGCLKCTAASTVHALHCQVLCAVEDNKLSTLVLMNIHTQYCRH